MGSKSVTLPPSLNGPSSSSSSDHHHHHRPSPVATFFRRMGGALGRGRSPTRKTADIKDNEQSKSSSSKSPARLVGQTLSRLSMRRKEKKRDESSDRCSPPPLPSLLHDQLPSSTTTTPRGLPPRPAISENDLRNITIRRGSNDIPITPLAGVHQYMSEDNLVGAEFGSVPYRTPSYVRISCTLNGYRSPRRSEEPSQISTTPVRTTNHVGGRSIVERRLDQIRHNTMCPGTPAISSSPDHTTTRSTTTTSSIDYPPSTPISSIPSNMGNAQCTPTPVRNLIHQFDKLHLCSTDEEQKENVKPHSLIINEQPMGEGEDMKKDAKRLQFDEDEVEKKRREEEKEKLEKRLNGEDNEKKKNEEEEVNHNVINVDMKKDEVINEMKKKEINDQIVRDGTFFLNLLSTTRESLSTSAKNAQEELDRLQNDLSESASAVFRIVIGKTLLLNGKKLNKFEELVQKNLYPKADDPQPATVDDLEGYWGLVEIELEDIAGSLKDLDEWRSRGWIDRVEEKSPSQTSRDGSDSGRGTEDGGASRPSSRGRVVPSKTSRPPIQSEKAKAAEDKRKATMAAARERMRMMKKNQDEEGRGGVDGGSNDVLMVL